MAAAQRHLAIAGLILALGGLPPGDGTAQTAIQSEGPLRFGLGGYIQTFTGIHDRGYDLPDLPGTPTGPRTSGFHSQVVRLQGHVEGKGWRLDVHDRLQARITTGSGTGPAIGLGVSTIPDRLVDTESRLLDEPGLRLWHDIDRLSLSLFTPAADITVGRQPITWGISGIFPVADLWARFSPFELETEEKPGIDAVRALFYPRPGLEMDAVLAHRGSREDLSAGIRATRSFPSADAWVGAGKFWRQAMAMGGVTLLLDQARIRGEIVVPWDLDASDLQDPRATLGADWIRGTLAVTAEYHFNGIGVPNARAYATAVQDPRFGRETYYLGRHYLGGMASWSPDEENRVTLALNALANLQDASTALTPVVAYDLGQATRLSLGALVSFGETPRVTPIPGLRSEFGAYGDLLFTRVSLYF